MKYLITILLLFFSLFICAQENSKDSTASCRANWQKGDNKVLSITHFQRNFKSGKLSSVLNLTYEAHISVLSTGETEDTIQWILHLPEKFKKENPDYEKTMHGYDGMKMIFITNKSGSFRELINWEEIKGVYIKMFEASLPENLTDSMRTAIKKSYDLFDTREMVESAFIREIQIYYSPYGGDYSTAEKIIPITFPNPFGREPLPALFKHKISGLNPQLNYFKIVLTQEMDSLAIRELMAGMINKMNLASETDMAEMKKQLSDFKINDRSEFDVLRQTGWIKKLLRVRTANTGANMEIDSYSMKIQ